jgi:hypothetical protein
VRYCPPFRLVFCHSPAAFSIGPLPVLFIVHLLPVRSIQRPDRQHTFRPQQRLQPIQRPDDVHGDVPCSNRAWECWRSRLASSRHRSRGDLRWGTRFGGHGSPSSLNTRSIIRRIASEREGRSPCWRRQLSMRVSNSRVVTSCTRWSCFSLLIGVIVDTCAFYVKCVS